MIIDNTRSNAPSQLPGGTGGQENLIFKLICCSEFCPTSIAANFALCFHPHSPPSSVNLCLVSAHTWWTRAASSTGGEQRNGRGWREGAETQFTSEGKETDMRLLSRCLSCNDTPPIYPHLIHCDLGFLKKRTVSGSIISIIMYLQFLISIQHKI